MCRVFLWGAAGLLAVYLPAWSQEPTPSFQPAAPPPVRAMTAPPTIPTRVPPVGAVSGGQAFPYCPEAVGVGDCGKPCDVCCPPRCPPRDPFWIEADYIYWFLRGNPLPALVTASPAGTPRPAAGVLGQPTTTVLLGNERVNDDGRSGFLVRGGIWLDDCQTCGLESSFFVLGNHARSDVFGANDGATLARPFFNTLTGAQDAELVAFPGVVTGSVGVHTTINFYGGDVNARTNLCCGCAGWLDVLAGYRYLRLTEDTDISESLTTLSAERGVPPGTQIGVLDQFRTENTFNGGQVGLAGEYRMGCWSVDARGLVALGDLHRVVHIAGATAVTLPGQPAVYRPGGLLAQASNSGRHSSDVFAVLPEVGVSLGYQLTRHMRATVGYSFLYVSRVTRPGDVIDLALDPRQLTGGSVAGATRPRFEDRGGDFWVQGLTAGLELRY